MRNRIARLFAGLLAGLAALPAAADYVTGLDPQGDNFLALRSGPGTQYQMLRQMPPDTVVTVLETYGSWRRVELEDGASGWAFGKFIAAGLPPGSFGAETAGLDDWVGLTGQTGAIAPGGAVLRTLPHARSDAVAEAQAGAGVIVLGEAAGWLRVISAAGHTGYVPATAVELGVWPSAVAAAPDRKGKGPASTGSD